MEPNLLCRPSFEHPKMFQGCQTGRRISFMQVQRDYSVRKEHSMGFPAIDTPLASLIQLHWNTANNGNIVEYG
jgi:hypothetical protein